ncbi:MAG: metallophosphoesterase [Bilophila sp.]
MYSSFLSLVMGLIALYVIVRIVLPAQTRVVAKVLYSLAVLVSAERLLILWWLTGTMNALLSRPVLLVTSFLQIMVLMLFMLTLFRDLLRGALWLAHRVHRAQRVPSAGFFRRTARFLPQSLMMTLIAALLTGYGMYEALRVPSVQQVRLVVPGLPSGLEGLRIVQLSDLHIGSAFGQDWLTQVVRQTNALHPDLTVITGDMVDGTPDRLAQDVAPLATLRAKYGVFLVVGNHEYYSGLEDWLAHFQSMGLSVLLNSHVALDVKGTPLVLAGTADPRAKRLPGAALPEPERIMDDITRLYGKVTTVMLAHNPALAPRSAQAGATLQLSGHTHGGIVLPIVPLVAHFNAGYVSGLYTVGTMPLYVSCGTGLWGGLPVRLLVPSEITLLTLTGQVSHKAIH